MQSLLDIDPLETREWVDALESVLAVEGTDRAHFLMQQLAEKARRSGAQLPYSAKTPYLNTIPPHLEEKSPGNYELEHRLRLYVRWNAAAMVLRAGKKSLDLGGHIASFASAATLYDVGFNHFWRAPTKDFGGDLVYFQETGMTDISASTEGDGLFSNRNFSGLSMRYWTANCRSTIAWSPVRISASFGTLFLTLLR